MPSFELAAFNPGLCVITTRLPVADLADREGAGGSSNANWRDAYGSPSLSLIITDRFKIVLEKSRRLSRCAALAMCLCQHGFVA
jgi:hypothetical protein